VGTYEDKLENRFDTFDRDGDGVISAQDFEAMAQRILDEFGIGQESPKAAALLAGAQQYWAAFAEYADVDRDGEISRTEWLGAANQKLRGNPDGFREAILPWSTAVVAVADTSGDGAVSVAEWAHMLRAMGVPEAKASARARELDTDHDGTVSVDEVMATAVTFYTSDTPMPDFAPAH
jgi:Ca2+-binding EF-hand superfamily protein